MAEENLRLKLLLQQQQSQGAAAQEQVADSRFAPGTTTEQAANVPPEMVYDPQTGGYIDAALAAQRVPGYARAAATAVKGVPFAGEYADEVLGALSGQAGQTEVARQMQSQFAEEHPVATPIMQIGTGIAATAPVALGSGLIKGAGLVQKGLKALGMGAFFGGTEGAISGYGAGVGEGRTGEAIKRGMIGTAAGAVLAPAATLIGAGTRKVGEWFADRPLKAAATAMGVTPTVARVIRSISQATDIDEAQKVLKTAGGDTFLADLSPKASNLLDAMMQTASEAPQIGMKAITARAEGANSRLVAEMNKAFGGAPSGMTSIVDSIKNRLTPEAQKLQRAATPGQPMPEGALETVAQKTTRLYNQAYTTAIDYTTPAGRAVESLMGRLPKGPLAAAIKTTNERMKMREIDIEQILVDEAGNKTSLLNVAQLDHLKRTYDAIVRDGTDGITGKLNAAAVDAKYAATQIRNITRNASAAYGEALKTASGPLGQQEAVDFGSRMLRNGDKYTRDTVARVLKDMTAPELEAARLGAREHIDEMMAVVTRTASDPQVEVRQVQKILTALSSPSARKKLVLLLGGDNSKKVFNELDRAGIALNLKAATIANSRTAGRLMEKEAIDAMTGRPILEAIGSGKPIASTQEMVKLMTGMTDEAIEARRGGLYAEIASALVNIRGDNAMKALRLMRNLDVAAPISNSRANAFAIAMRPFWVAAQQETTRALTEDQ